MTTIAVFVGSLRADSINHKLARNLEAMAPEDTRFEYIDLNLPLFNQDLEGSYPDEVQTQKDKVIHADGVLIVTPEYNRSVPGVLKNALDWFSRPYGKNAFDRKPLGLTGASGGPVGTAVAQSDLRHIAGYLNMRLMGQPELYFNFASDKLDDDGNVIPEYREQLQAYITSFVEFVSKF